MFEICQRYMMLPQVHHQLINRRSRIHAFAANVRVVEPIIQANVREIRLYENIERKNNIRHKRLVDYIRKDCLEHMFM
jgi:hypothetical protein